MPAHRLRYEGPATTWLEALPVGDGRLGAVCWGLADGERLSLNDDRAWSGPVGGPHHPTPPDHPDRVEAARAAVLAGDPTRAGELLEPVVHHTQAFLPVGDLLVTTAAAAAPGVVRGLDLGTATAWSQRPVPGGTVRHETSVGAGVLVHRVTAPGAGTGLRLALASPLRPAGSTLRVPDGDPGGLEWRTLLDLPEDVHPWHPDQHEDPVRWAAPGTPSRQVAVVVRVRCDGTPRAAPDPAGPVEGPAWDGVREAHVVVAVETPDPATDPTGRPDVEAAAARAAAAVADPGAVRERHRREHAELFGRSDLDLGGRVPAGATTDALVGLAEHDEDAARVLAALAVAHARYLLVTGSRPGTLPLTLQGIWNEELQPPWSSNYTLNVNLPMAYWPVQPWGLPECAEPLLAFAERLAAAGTATAAEMYGARGWVAHHNSDGWAQTRSVGGGWNDPAWSAWPYGGVWLSLNLLDALDFAADPGPLARRVLPVVEGAVRFCLDRLVVLPDGTLGTAPSTSPENHWLDAAGNAQAVERSSTCDLELTRGLLTGWSRWAGRQTHAPVPADLRAEVEAALAGLPHPGTGARGELLEWHAELAEAEPEHRHTSHLVGLYPLGTIAAGTSAAAAAARSLDLRGPESTGWALAWRTALRARLRDGAAVGDLVRRCLRPATDGHGTGGGAAHRGGLYPNLFSAHPPFQVDGNLGFAAAVAEVLVQSGADRVDLLPALPPQWPEGRVRGLRTRAGVEVDLTWSGSAPVSVRLRYLRPSTVRLTFGGTVLAETSGTTGDEHDVPLAAPPVRDTPGPSARERRGTP